MCTKIKIYDSIGKKGGDTMAIIKCPKCSKEISDKSNKCIHCGYVVEKKKMKKCVECGMKLENNMTICPKCGCPVEITNTQKVEVTKIRNPFSKKQVIISLCVILMTLMLILFGIYANKQKQKKINEEYLTNYQDYMNDAVTKMLEGAVEAEYCGNLIKEVWSDTINKDHYNSSTSKYIKTEYGYTSDFNTSLKSLFEDEEFSKKITLIEDNREEVDRIMKKLINPSEEYKEAYTMLKEYYDNYYSLTELAINPTGSLTTYSNNFNQADTDTARSYNKIKTYLNN